MKPQCATCIFWARDKTERFGWCYRYPPAVIASKNGTGWKTLRPITNETAWCGEWDDKLED